MPDAPSSPPLRRTPARDACYRVLTSAIHKRWTVRELSAAANCDMAVAGDVLAEVSEQIRADAERAIGVETQKMAEEARKVRTRSLARLERLGKVLDNLTASLEAKGNDVSARDVVSAVKAGSELWKQTESLTGLDVVKAIAAKQAPQAGSEATAWDGVAALEAVPVASQQEDLTGISGSLLSH
ncbi:hypothetical protein SAMN02745166_01067 [Prosthecobacter debontii]|uniref:Uncharacterized protein n=1 Tax=Prosthecobacter debontii TaxID=48467 RepID=A0A1T4X7L1_9BACT|nr:hypothetical protein [Prosthecobacter debontii]SKA84831.1 hypothetical protein SAMN02745166_01067 [Prosthecobacter debontii]